MALETDAITSNGNADLNAAPTGDFNGGLMEALGQVLGMTVVAQENQMEMQVLYTKDGVPFGLALVPVGHDMSTGFPDGYGVTYNAGNGVSTITNSEGDVVGHMAAPPIDGTENAGATPLPLVTWSYEGTWKYTSQGWTWVAWPTGSNLSSTKTFSCNHTGWALNGWLGYWSDGMRTGSESGSW